LLRQKESWAKGVEEKQRQLQILVDEKKEELQVMQIAISKQASEVRAKEMHMVET